MIASSSPTGLISGFVVIGTTLAVITAFRWRSWQRQPLAGLPDHAGGALRHPGGRQAAPRPGARRRHQILARVHARPPASPSSPRSPTCSSGKSTWPRPTTPSWTSTFRPCFAAKRAAGVTGADYAKAVAATDAMRASTPTRSIACPETFVEIFPVGLLIALVSAALLRNPEDPAGKSRPAVA